MLTIKNYTKTFGTKKIFEGFDLEIKAGEMVALTGPSGSGKTTLLNTLGLIEPLEVGEYYLSGEKAPKVNSRAANHLIREKISYLFQNFALVDNLTVEENLMMALRYVKKSLSEKNKMIDEALERVGLPSYQKLKIFEISGGEQQRVAIARTILKPSQIVLADEPTGALDPKNRDEILAILHQLNREGKTIVIVTHDEVVAQNCTRMIQL